MDDILSRVNRDDVGMVRRDFLKSVAATASLVVTGKNTAAFSGMRASWLDDTLNYLETLRRADGGYAWPQQTQSHLTPSYAVTGCYNLLGRIPPDKERLIRFIRENHPFRIKKLERDLKVFEYQQIRSLLWLGENADSFKEQVRSWTKPSLYPRQYERHGYPVLRFEAMAFLCRRLLGLAMDDISPELIEYIENRRRPNGSFNNTPANDGGDGHVMNTWWAVQALDAIGSSGDKRRQTVAWVRACQLPGGGFTYQPEPAFAGVDDVTYTWAAVRILKLFDARPARRKACVAYLLSLRSSDGGFGDRPGRPGNPMATYRALDALRALDGLDWPSFSVRRRSARTGNPLLPEDLKVFTIQIEAHGKGSPVEAVELARALRIDLWGAKNAAPGWIAAAQAVADRQKVPVTFFVANEEYGTFVDVPGMGTYSHTSDIIAPAGVDFGPSLSGGQAVSWEQFRRQRLAPLHQAGGRLIWQFNENEELTRLYLDDSLLRGGYDAISTFHFGNPDFTNSEPFLKHYHRRIPFIALQDAHGSEPWWWADMLTGFRTLFLAVEPTWDQWLTALERNRVVAVRHDAVSSNKTLMHGGSHGVADFVRRRERHWRWWDNPRISRPPVSVVAVTPGDKWETARPESGVTIRVRCRWGNTTQGLPKFQQVEMLKLMVDGRQVEPKLVAPKAKWGAYQDYYHYHHISRPAPGGHKATVVVRSLETKAVSEKTIEFVV